MAKKLTDYRQTQINGTAKSNTSYMRLHKIKKHHEKDIPYISGGQDPFNVRAVNMAHENPETKVKIYRGIPKNAPKSQQRIFRGDWVSLSPNVAKDYPLSGDWVSSDKFIKHQGKIITKLVRARDLSWAGDTLDEFGYNPTKYKPKNKKIVYNLPTNEK